jgi:hypothetical protein
MSAPINAILTGQFTGSSAIQYVTLPSGYQKFEMFNLTDLGTAGTTSVMTVQGSSYMPAGSAYYGVGSGASSIITEKFTATNGLTFIMDSGGQPISAQLTGQSLSSAAPGVVGSTATGGLQNGNIVRLYNVTNDQQLSGMDFTVSAVTANTQFSLQYLDTTQTNLGTATTLNYRIIPFDSRYYPRRRFITNMESSGTNTIITLSVTHGYTAGQAVRIYVPTNFGTGTNPFISGPIGSGINAVGQGIAATIVAVGAADASGFTNTITVNVNSSAFTWGWPTSASFAAGSQVPFVVPVGEAAVNTVALPYGNSLNDATYNTSFNGVQIGTTVQTNAKVYQWMAYSGIALS